LYFWHRLSINKQYRQQAKDFSCFNELLAYSIKLF
jgi:hypothetical protein